MTTRHTISHADELYSGAAFKDGYSPDGRRGIKMTHLYAHEFLSTAGVPPVAGDPDGFCCLLVSTASWNAAGGNVISTMSGALIGTTGATVINLDVPRNVVITCCQAGLSGVYVKVHGTDQYGEPMAEAIKCHVASAQASGVRAFKSIHKIYTTAALVSMVIMGTGNRLGLPFHLANVGKLVSLTIAGHTASGTTLSYTIHIGASAATTITTNNAAPDVRGTIRMISPAPNGSIRFTALMVVDHSTNRKAFGPPQVSECSNGVA